jgi:hypothetical protein
MSFDKNDRRWAENQPMTKDEDRLATQMFAIRSILVMRCGQLLTADLIDDMMEEVKREITKGSCSWAFKKE